MFTGRTYTIINGVSYSFESRSPQSWHDNTKSQIGAVISIAELSSGDESRLLADGQTCCSLWRSSMLSHVSSTLMPWAFDLVILRLKTSLRPTLCHTALYAVPCTWYDLYLSSCAISGQECDLAPWQVH